MSMPGKKNNSNPRKMDESDQMSALMAWKLSMQMRSARSIERHSVSCTSEWKKFRVRCGVCVSAKSAEITSILTITNNNNYLPLHARATHRLFFVARRLLWVVCCSECNNTSISICQFHIHSYTLTCKHTHSHERAHGLNHTNTHTHTHIQYTHS